MSKLRISGDSSGYVDLEAPATAGTTTIALEQIPLKNAANVFTSNMTVAGNVGVGTTTPGEKLEVDGVIQINRTGDHPAIRFQEGGTTRGYIGSGDWAVNYLADDDFGISSSTTGDLVLGTAGTERMRIDSAGLVTKPNQPSFKVNGDNVSVGSSGFGATPFNLDSGNDSFDNGNNYNTTNYRFVAPVAGKYFFAANVRMDNMGGAYFRLLISKNGGDLTNDGVHSIVGNGMSTNYHTLNVSGIINCAANDYVQVRHYANNDTSWNLSLSESGFSGFLIG